MSYTKTNFVNILNEYSIGKDSAAVANVRSALLRCYTKGLQGKKTKKVRFTAQMLKRAENFLENTPLDLANFDSHYHLQILDKGCELLEINENNQRSIRSYFKRLLNFIDEKYINLQPEITATKPQIEVHTVRKQIMDKSYIEEQKVKKQKNKKIALSSNPYDFLDRLQIKYPEQTEKELIIIAQKHLNRISQDFSNYSLFQSKLKIRDVTIEKRGHFLFRILGWWYITNEDKTIEDLSFKTIIPVIDTNVDREEMDYEMTTIYVKEGKLRDETKKKSKKLIDFINKFFRDYGVSNIHTANHYIDSLTSYAKFLYQDITDTLEFDDYEDITLIRYLRVRRKKNQDICEKGETKNLPLSWDEVMNVMYAMKKDYDTERYEYIYHKYNKEYIGKHEKTEIQKAKQLQAFLMVISFGIIPPKRQRIIRELSFGKTLKYGKIDANSYIIPLDPQTDKNKEGNYILDLTPDDQKNGSKIGKSYREMIPNRQFEDGTYFYDYLNEWLFQYRKFLVKTDVETVFVREIKGDAFTKDSVWQKVNSIFKTKTGVSINPHLLRHIFVTFLANNEVDDAKKRAAAISMGHDPITAEKYYCKQTDEQMVLPIAEYMNNIWTDKNTSS
jgi:hypothetical protein